MSVERRLPHFIKGLFTSEKKESPFEELKSYALRAITAAERHLEGTRLDSVKGRRVDVKLPKRKRGYRITSVSESDKNHVTEDLKITSLRQNSNGAFELDPFFPWIEFHLPFNTDNSLWSSEEPFSKSMMKKLARHLERAVPKK